VKLSICIVTYKRPQFLNDLLTSLCEQVWLPDPADLDVVIVDTDPDCTAQYIFESFKKKVMFKVIYDTLERRRNESEGRNRCVKLASMDLVLLIDDDQILTPVTLQELRDFWANQPDTVSGARLGIDYLFPPNASWMQGIRGFYKTNIPDGNKMPGDHVGTGGTLVRKRVFDWKDDPFDITWGFRGGYDNAFFSEAEERGELFVSCGSICINEQVGSDRATINYLLRRNFRQGMSYAQLKLQRYNFLMTFKYMFETLLALTIATLLTVAALPFGKKKILDRFSLFIRQLGKISAIFGCHYEIYK